MITHKFRRATAMLLAASISYAGALQGAQAALIGTEQVAATQNQAATDGRARLEATLSRADVVAALQDRGVNVDAARERVAALTDAEAAHVAAQIDSAPAGADGVLGTIVFIFVVLLITDILGFTKIFPFTRTIR